MCASVMCASVMCASVMCASVMCASVMCASVCHMDLHILLSAVPDKPHPDVQDTSNPKLKLMRKVSRGTQMAVYFKLLCIFFPAL